MSVAFKSNGVISMGELRDYFSLGTGVISASNLRGITSGIAFTGQLGLGSFYGKRNLNITSTTMAFNIGTAGIAPWNGSFADPAAQWLWVDSNWGQKNTNVNYNLFQINYTNATDSNITGTLYYNGDNLTYASHNKLALNGGAIYTGGSPNWSTMTSSAVTILPGKNLFEFVVRNLTVGYAGLIFFLNANGSNILRSDNVNALLSNCSRTYVGGSSGNPISIV